MIALDGLRFPAFGQEGVWLRCNLHAHSTNSDGLLDVRQLARLYDRAGYDLLAISDHDLLSELPNHDGSMLLMSASEISLRAPVTGGPLHVLALGVERMPDVERSTPFAEAVSAIVEAGGLAVVAHPWWSGLRPDELEPYENVTAVEVFNTSCEVEQGRGHAAMFWDSLLANGTQVGGIAADDHHWPGFDTFQGWTMVRAAERSVEAVLAALKSGSYYASMGPAIIDISLQEDDVIVTTSPAVAISLVAQPPFGGRVSSGSHGMNERGMSASQVGGRRTGAIDGEPITSARFPIRTDVDIRYLRVQVKDSRGRYAWSNPIWLQDS